MTKHKYSTYTLIIFGVIFVSILAGALTSSEVDTLCNTDGKYLYRQTGNWTCGDAVGNTTIIYNGTTNNITNNFTMDMNAYWNITQDYNNDTLSWLSINSQVWNYTAWINALTTNISLKLDTTDQRYNETSKLNSINSTQTTDNDTQAGQIGARALPGQCAGTTVVQNTTTSGVQCYTPTASANVNNTDLNVTTEIIKSTEKFLNTTGSAAFTWQVDSSNRLSLTDQSDAFMTCTQADACYIRGFSTDSMDASNITAGTLAVARGGTGVGTSTGTGNAVLSNNPTMNNITIGINGWIKLNATNVLVACSVANQGSIMYNYTLKRHVGCNSTHWVNLY